MNHTQFIEKAKQIVGVKFGIDTVFIVWSCKTLQNSKAILSSTVYDAPLYEITMNGDKGEIYVDTYIKESNEKITIK